jgi:hypothetical protein|nr:metalloregulator ArsR/SmtB family transcription factor [Candidatus Krumholzibacteria bacterium]
MTAETSSLLLKALADPNRLRIVRALLEAPCYVEQLAAGLNLAAPTISHHLKKLEQVGLVAGTREQYYTVYQLDAGILDQRLLDLVTEAGDGQVAEGQRLEAYRQKILDTFFHDGRLNQLPAQRKKRLVVLDAFAADFAPDRMYSEEEVNQIIAARFDDYCTVRRELVDSLVMSRRQSSSGILSYQRIRKPEVSTLPQPGDRPRRERPMTTEERKAKVQLYKQARKQAGIYGIRNRETGRLLLGSSLNLHGPLNRHRAELRFGSHRCRQLQEDWNAYGPEGFDFEVFDTVDSGLTGLEREAALRKLEKEWLVQLQPFTARCYNTSEQIRTKPY